ncbi:MAG: TMEM43 family protein [Verrucomicrobia bacterium]|nr:TMEM43 family protein [Verrucomicrobiota bacterium]
MADEFTDITSQSWGGRILDSIKGILVGIILVPISVILLFWNENRAVDTARGLKEGAAAVVSIDEGTVVPANERKLVHLSGEATSSEVLRDPMFAVSATAIRLTRTVEMYQWKEEKSSETRKKLGGGSETVTNSKYLKTWSASLINSADFKEPENHRNPAAMLAPPLPTVASDVKLGAFKLPSGVIAKMTGDEPLAATEADLAKTAPELQGKLKLDAGAFYVGQDPTSPALGDQRVTFKVLKPAVWSVIARQTGDTLEPFVPHVGPAIERVESGTVSADLMFQHAASENAMLTWGLRLGGFVLMALGLGLIIKPLSVLADVLPFLGNVIGVGGVITAMLLAFVGSLVVIAVAWFAVRPLLTIGLGAVALVGLVMAWRRGKRRRAIAALQS